MYRIGELKMPFARASNCVLMLGLLALCAGFAVQAEDKEEGFKPLFNGKDHTGWTGNLKGYPIVEGTITVDPKQGGGNLYTEREYKDFSLRFEFKLTPGANNGIGIRTPKEGDPAYVGMEIQVLDDGHEKYKGIQPWQRHGSVYGIAPAKSGFLKPTGEWNSEEIIVKGREITVKLNGETIVHVPDLDKVETPTPRDKHTGIDNKQGFICFCGHGDPLAFRNLRIKEL